MDFFSRHIEGNDSPALPSLSLSSNPGGVQHHLPAHKAFCQSFPLAISTPLSLPKRLIKEVQPEVLNNLPPKENHMSIEPSLPNNEGNTSQDCSNSHASIVASSDVTYKKENTSISKTRSPTSELRMEMLYESLQTEAQKIQQFKVHVMAQMKQKSEENLMKESQIKNLNEEVTSMKSENSTLISELRRQKRLNEDILSKVAITREMCFALAEEHAALKDLMKLGRKMFVELKEKTSNHSKFVKAAVIKVDTYHSTTEKTVLQIEQTVETRETAVSQLIEKHVLTRKSLQKEVEDKKSQCGDLHRALDNSQEELRQLQEQLASLVKSSNQKEAELIATMDELSLTKNDELFALQEKLNAIIASNARAEQESQQTLRAVREELSQTLEELQATSIKLQDEVSKCKKLSADIVEYDEKVGEKESCIALLEQSKGNLEHDLMTCQEQLKEAKKSLKDSSAALAVSQANADELKAGLQHQLAERNNEIQSLKLAKEELLADKEDLQTSQQKLEEKYNSLESVNTTMADALKCTEQDLTAKKDLLDTAHKKLDGLKEKLKSAIMENEASNKMADIEISKLKLDHKKTVENYSSTVSELERALELTESKLNKAAADYEDLLMQSDSKLVSLEESMMNQKLEYESTIKEKTTAFSKAQYELQRMLDEAVANGKQQIASLEKEMNCRTAELEANLLANTANFTKTEADLQDKLSKIAKTLAEETQKVEDLNQDLQITKDSLEKSLMEKNVMAMALAKETQEKQDLSNRLLAKECEFNKLMSAVQNLKSRWASVATPLTPVATPPSVQQATIKPTSYSTPMKQVPAGLPSTPTVGRSPASLDSTTPLKSMPISDNVTPKSESSITVHSAFNTPRTPNSSFLLDNPKGILRNLGSASKSNRVVFSTPIEQKSLIVAPSESDTSVLDIEVVNKSLQAKSPETQLVNLSKTSNLSHSSKRSPLTHTKPTANALNNCNQSQANDPVSPALSSQSGERLPRSKMLKSGTGRKRLRPPGRREELGLITKAMKKHRFLMEHPATTGKKAIRESDSDCFGFGSE